ncbi:MAG: HAMP domain-containing protein [Desulfobacteraceae bacterium]|nr:HAMP domain-containing protein [Desulfobacteraceae bacterium]
MTITCDKCGATYQIDPEKIKTDTIRFACKTCSDFVIVNKNDLIDKSENSELTSFLETQETETVAPVSKETKTKGVGIRTKMFALLIILIVAFAGQAYYLIMQLNIMTDRFGLQGTNIIKEMAEQEIMNTADSVASQVSLYLESHPDLTKENFMTDGHFRNIAIQPVGKKGYTALYEKGKEGKFRTWVHKNPRITAPSLDDMSKLKGPLGASFPGFWKVLTGVNGTIPSKGYYRWQEKDQSFKDKYMACVNVKGTGFYIASTTYIDEFTLPMQSLENKSKEIAKTQSINIAIIISIISIVVAIIVFIFGNRLTSNIKYLSEVTDRISLGDLDALIETRSSDELAVLTESISRLQQSVRLSIKRLRG